jgi:outer membrane protein assembly factor BamB
VACNTRHAGRSRVGLVHTVHLEARRPDRARRDRTQDGRRVQPRRQGVVAAARPHRTVDAESRRVGHHAVRQHRIAGRVEPAAVCGGAGDISLVAGSAKNDWVAWTHPRASAYTSSPLLYRGRVYVVNDNGILIVLDAQTGREIYKERVGGTGHTFSASPWAIDGKIFFLSEDGLTIVIEAGDTYLELAKNDLGEMSLATPALAPDAMFVRTMTRLYRIAGQ